MRYVDITGWIENGMWSYSSVYPGATVTECPHPPELPADYDVVRDTIYRELERRVG